MDFLALAGLILLLFGHNLSTQLTGPVAVGITTFVFVCASLCSAWVRKVLGNELIAVIGGMCYSIYLIHLPILEVASSVSCRVITPGIFSYPVYFLIQFALLSTLVLVSGWCFFLLIERPCMDKRWPQKLVASVRGILPLK